MQHFVHVFAGVISESAPHIYLSALPLAPRNSAVSCRYLAYYPQVLKLERGGQENWPAMQKLLSGHELSVYSVAVSPDGKYIASGSWDKTIRVWDAETGEMIGRPLENHGQSVTCVASFPDGKRIVSGSWDAKMRVWNVESGKETGLSFRGHESAISSISVSSSGKTIASGSNDRTMRLWNAETGDMIGHPFDHSSKVCFVAFSPNEKQVISATYEAFTVWDVEKIEVISREKIGVCAIYSLRMGKALPMGCGMERFTCGMWQMEGQSANHS
jgi:WD40 repeat protein